MQRRLFLAGVLMLLVWISGIRPDTFEDAADPDDLPWNTVVRSPVAVEGDSTLLQPACDHGHCDTALRVDEPGRGTAHVYWRAPWASDGSTPRTAGPGNGTTLHVSDATYHARDVAFDVTWLALAVGALRLGFNDRHARACTIGILATVPFWALYGDLWLIIVGPLVPFLLLGPIGWLIRVMLPDSPQAQGVGRAVIEAGLVVIPLAVAMVPYAALPPLF